MPTPKPPVTNDQVFQAVLRDPRLIMNAMTSRADLMAKLFDPRRDIDDECGYPKEVNEAQYRKMYDRELGRRVVNIFPEETWQRFPTIYEDADPEVSTPFEETLEAVDQKHHLLHYLQRADELSGVGQYGVILWGLDDGKLLNEPVDGSDTWEEATGKPNTATPPERNVLFIRVLDASLVRISAYESNPTKPRYGLPTQYTITVSDPRNLESGGVASPSTKETSVHWSRITHVADNRGTSEVLGTPRMLPVWNRLYDLRKILGGNGEMFWRGGFPGVSLETQKGLGDVEVDEDSVRQVMFNYMNGLQRYIALTGMSAKSLAPQISDPTASFDAQVKAICITLGVPYRVFMGIEEGVVSGDQATKAWAGRLANRQARYVTPMLIDPVLQRLIDYGAVKPTVEPHGWTVDWPDITEPDAGEEAKTAQARTQALAAYVAGGVDALVPPLEFLTLFCGLEDAVAKSILDAAIEHIGSIESDETVPGRLPTPPELEPGPDGGQFGDKGNPPAKGRKAGE